jgi:hypothetical protein
LSPSGLALAAQGKKDAEDHARWLAAMPKSLQPTWTDMAAAGYYDIKSMRALLAAEFPEATPRARALLNWYGSISGSWHATPAFELAPEALLRDFAPAEMVSALQSAPLTDTQLEGAARFFAGGDGDPGILPAAIKASLLEYALKSTNANNIKWAKQAFSPPPPDDTTPPAAAK